MKFNIKIFLLFFIIHPINSKAQNFALQKKGVATIMVELEDSQPKDTLMLLYFKDNLFNETRQNSEYEEMHSPPSSGLYKFKLLITEQTGYFFLAKKTQGKFKFIPISNLLKAEAGDNVTLKINCNNSKAKNLVIMYSYSCLGLGSEKYNIRFKLDSLLYWAKPVNTPIFSDTFKYNDDNQNRNRINVALDYLNLNKNGLNTYQFQLLKADILFSNSFSFFLSIKTTFKSLTGNDKNKFIKEYLSSVGEINLYGFSPEILVNSKSAISYFLQQAQTTVLITGKANEPDALYNYLCTNYSGAILDKLLVYYFMGANIPINDFQNQIDDAITKIKTFSYLEKLKIIKKRFQVSNQSKEYDLMDGSGRLVSLADFKGKVVFVDFWFTGCAFCTKYIKEQLVNVEGNFKNNPDVVFLSLSIDRVKDTWLSSVNSMKYTLPSSINLYTNGLGKNHALIKKLNLQGYPSIMILDKMGNIVEFGTVEESTKPRLYQSTSIIGIIQELLLK